MTRGVFNWTYKDVVAFLKANDFSLNHTDSSHHYYVKYTPNKIYQVEVPYHGNKVFKPRTLNSMILQSGIERKIWLER